MDFGIFDSRHVTNQIRQRSSNFDQFFGNNPSGQLQVHSSGEDVGFAQPYHSEIGTLVTSNPIVLATCCDRGTTWASSATKTTGSPSYTEGHPMGAGDEGYCVRTNRGWHSGNEAQTTCGWNLLGHGGDPHVGRNNEESEFPLRGLVFEPHPQLHGFPWKVASSKKTRNVLAELKKQSKKRCFRAASKNLGTILEKWGHDEWARGQQSQKPKQLWDHSNTLTDYQVWVAYRIATSQLNLYYEGKEHEQGCPLDEDCINPSTSVTHIAWSCRRAQAYWTRVLQHWLGYEVNSQRLEEFKHYFSARTAPPLGERFKKRLIDRYGQWWVEYAEQPQRNWWALCSIGNALLWQLRNHVVHEGQKWAAPRQLEFMWSSSMRQLHAVARSERKRPRSRIQGLQLQISLECLEEKVVEIPPNDPPPPPAPWLKQAELGLPKRLKLFSGS